LLAIPVFLRAGKDNNQAQRDQQRADKNSSNVGISYTFDLNLPPAECKLWRGEGEFRVPDRAAESAPAGPSSEPLLIGFCGSIAPDPAPFEDQSPPMRPMRMGG
jgi:hypothetical protein